MQICEIDLLLHRNNMINQSSKGKKVVQEETINRAILTKQECQKKRRPEIGHTLSIAYLSRLNK